MTTMETGVWPTVVFMISVDVVVIGGLLIAALVAHRAGRTVGT
jgi:hypothetical protein